MFVLYSQNFSDNVYLLFPLFPRKLIKALKRCGLIGSLVDPCLWIKGSNSGMVMMAIYVEMSSIFRTDPEAYDNKSRNT
jgi:hypothetical protein